MNHLLAAAILPVLLSSCLYDTTKEKWGKAKEGISNATTLMKEAQNVEGRIDKLKNETALTNEQLKSWLPESLDGLERTGFKVGQAGYAGVNSVSGTYSSENGKKAFELTVVDGAGPTGGVMVASYGMLGNMEMEEENEYKHQKTVTRKQIKAQQTYHKKSNNTELMFLYADRFLVTANAKDINTEQTWEIIETIDFENLVK